MNKKILHILLSIIGALALFPFQAFASPTWQDVPHELQHQVGSIQKGDYLFATGMAEAEIMDGRAGKAHERAQKKSLNRAMQQIHLVAACGDLLADLSQSDQQIFAELFIPLLPDLHMKGLTVVRQWQKNMFNFTTVALPMDALHDLTCPYFDLNAVISSYLDTEKRSIKGLTFCLNHTERYTDTGKVIRQHLTMLLNAQNGYYLVLPNSRELHDLLLQRRFAQANQRLETAKQLKSEGKWSQASAAAWGAVKLVPALSDAHFLLADYYLTIQNQPALALLAVEKGLRAGTNLQRGLQLQVNALQNLQSDEVEIWKYLLNKTRHNATDYPAEWEKELEILKDIRMVSLVIASCGQAVEGSSRQADPEFNRAVELYSKVKNDDDLLKVLSLLISAAEKELYSAKTWNLIGACYRNLHRPEMALPFLWQALKLKPDYDLAFTNLGLCCQELKLMKAAGYYFEQEAVKNSTNNWVKASYASFQGTGK